MVSLIIESQQLQMQNYDHEEDHSEKGEAAPTLENQLMQEFEDDYNFAKQQAEINELVISVKAHETGLRRVQKDLEVRVTESQLTETIALINAGIHSDPNIIKLLKTREGYQEESTDKVQANAQLFSRKLNQMSESLSVLLASIRRLEGRLTVTEADLHAQLNERISSLQTHMEETRGESVKDSMELQQKMEVLSFDVTDKLREVDTKVNWRLTEFKTKIDDKINQELVLMYLQQAEKRIDQNMRAFQLASNIDPERIDRIEAQLQAQRLASADGITECQFQLAALKKHISEDLLPKQVYQHTNVQIQKRLELFNSNFSDVYHRVRKCETEEVKMAADISKLLTDAQTALTELKRINTVLLNLRIGEDFQKMLEEMNPSKVLELQDTVDGVKLEQGNIFREIELAKREIDRINAKNQIMGVLQPNKTRDKLKKEELHEALHDYMTQNQFAQKITSLDRQVSEYRSSVDTVTLLTRQVARLQKENDSHRLALELRSLEEMFKKEIMLLHSKLKERHSYPEIGFLERPGSKEVSNSSLDPFPMGEAFQGRSFSLKRVSQPQNLSASRQIILGNVSKQIEMRTARK